MMIQPMLQDKQFRFKLSSLLLILLLLIVVQSPAVGQDTVTVETISLPDMPAYTMELSPTGDVLAVFAGSDALILLNVPNVEYEVIPQLLPIRLIEPYTGEELHRLPGSTDYISDVAFAPSGDVLATYHRNGDIILWDVATGEEIRRFDSIPNSGEIAFLGDDTTLLVESVSLFTMFLVVDTQSGAITRIIREQFDSFGELPLNDVFGRFDYNYPAWTVSPDGGLLVTATGNGEVTLWDIDTQEQTTVLPPAEEPGRLNVRALQFTADGSTLIYYNTEDDQTHFYDIASQSETLTVPGGSHAIAVSPDMRYLAWATRGDVWLLDTTQPENARQILVFDETLVSVATAVFTPDGSRLLVGGFRVDEPDANDNRIYVIPIAG